MRFIPAIWYKMFRYTSRLNVVLVIFCLGAVVFVWNRCQVEQFDKHLGPQIKYSTRHRDEEHGIQDSNVAVQEETDTKGVVQGNAESFDDEMKGNDANENKLSPINNKPASYKDIDVLVNGETKIKGRLENKEVYIPFSFIKDYFEVEGEIVHDDFGKQFHVQHTKYEYFTPKTNTYDPHGSFLWFVNYNVEGRSRVKCISGADEVPISIQWGPEGYRYPIQIAQYGLSHFSMLVEGPRGIVKVVDDCEKMGTQEWTATGEGASVKNVFNDERKSRVMEFNTNGSPKNLVTLPLVSSSKMYVLSFDVFFKSSGRIEVKLEVDDTKAFTLVYDTSETLMKTNKPTVTYGIGPTLKWRKITRNLWVDLSKLFGQRGRKKDKSRHKLHITEIQSLTLYGEGCIDNITLAEDGHKAAFLTSAHWLWKNQDKNGGWPIPVKRKIKPGTELKPGWYSAMAQGQAMSVLTRAYHITRDLKFLRAAQRALVLFHVKSKDNGILAVFMNKFKWYEEYPMTPSLFVLNGFLYSLMGLYDLKMTLPSDQRSKVEKLFNDGMTSLRAMILMFDSGSGTIYDLRHLTMDVEPNLARWDYHATHVNQVTWLTMIDDDPFYKQVLKRWQGYFKGIKAHHN